jgi:DNA-binding NarL/FixJ family response regulator
LKGTFEARSDYEVVGEASNGFDAVELAQRLQPDLVLLDLSLPGLGGLAVLRLLGQQMPDIRKVVITSSEDESDILEAVQAGANGYVLKTASVESLMEQLKDVATGGVAMTEQVTQRLMHALTKQQTASALDERQLHQSLKPQDVEILDLVAQGMTNREIAQILTMSEHTVRAHVRGLMHKLNVENRTQLAVYNTRASMGWGRGHHEEDTDTFEEARSRDPHVR